ncbi:MAG: DUF5908 family protein [Flavobacteriaceae bacterium]
MPVEIREIVIKTEIRSQEKVASHVELQATVQRLKRELLYECKKMMQQTNKKKHQKR